MLKRQKDMAGGRASQQTRTGLAVCGIAAAALLVTGCGSESGDSAGMDESGNAAATAAPTGTSASPSAGRLTEDQAERERLVPAAKVGYDKAGMTAQEKVSGGKLVSIELKGAKADGPEWETDVAESSGTVQKVTVDAADGKVTQSRTESDQDNEDKQKLVTRLGKAKVTWDKAAKTATDKKKGTVTTVELDDTDNDKLIWKVDVVTPDNWDKTTYDIDAVSGKVVREHVDRD